MEGRNDKKRVRKHLVYQFIAQNYCVYTQKEKHTKATACVLLFFDESKLHILTLKIFLGLLCFGVDCTHKHLFGLILIISLTQTLCKRLRKWIAYISIISMSFFQVKVGLLSLILSFYRLYCGYKLILSFNHLFPSFRISIIF